MSRHRNANAVFLTSANVGGVGGKDKKIVHGQMKLFILRFEAKKFPV